MSATDPLQPPDPPEENPYAVPKTGARELGRSRRSRRRRAGRRPALASPGSRLGAYLLDSVIPGFVGLAAFGALVAVDGTAQGGSLSSTGSFGFLIVGGLLLIYAVISLYLVATRSQTLGKLMVGIQIATPDGRRASFGRIFVLRGIVIGLISTAAALIPLGGIAWLLVDSLYIFREDRRCVHDHIAGTIVVPYRVDN